MYDVAKLYYTEILEVLSKRIILFWTKLCYTQVVDVPVHITILFPLIQGRHVLATLSITLPKGTAYNRCWWISMIDSVAAHM